MSDPLSYVGFVMRLPADLPAVKYDFMSYTSGSGDVPFKRNPKSWTFEGSYDGIHWDKLHEVVDNPTPVILAGRWFSSDTPNFETGYSVTNGLSLRLASVPYLSVSGNATVRTAYPISVSDVSVSVDGGTIDGFSFGTEGTLRLAGLVDQVVYDVPVTFANATGLENLTEWAVCRADGKILRSAAVEVDVDSGRVKVRKSGIVILVR